MSRSAPLAVPPELDRIADEADYAVIGPTDGRTEVLDTRRFPYSAICHIERDFGDGRLTGCSAFLVRPRLLLTAAHCIVSPIRARLGLRGEARRIRVTPGRAGARSRPFGTQWALRWRVHPQYRRNPSPAVDIGVIELAEPFSPAPGHFAMAFPPRAELDRLRQIRLLHISGYPGDKPVGTQWEHSERLDRHDARRLYYSVDTCPGHSGSPIWIKHGVEGPPIVIGVHTAGPRPHPEGPWGCRAGVPMAPAGLSNSGVRLTRRLGRILGFD
jgi:V8-like Glu-specific endopeptidase